MNYRPHPVQFWKGDKMVMAMDCPTPEVRRSGNELAEEMQCDIRLMHKERGIFTFAGVFHGKMEYTSCHGFRCRISDDFSVITPIEEGGES